MLSWIPNANAQRIHFFASAHHPGFKKSRITGDFEVNPPTLMIEPLEIAFMFSRCVSKARCIRLRPVRFFGARMGLISWCRVFFRCVWHGLSSSRTCFYIDASDSLLRVQERAVLVDNRQTHRTRRMPCAYSYSVALRLWTT